MIWSIGDTKISLRFSKSCADGSKFYVLVINQLVIYTSMTLPLEKEISDLQLIALAVDKIYTFYTLSDISAAAASPHKSQTT